MKKLTFEEIKKSFDKNNWKLLSDSYHGSQKNLLAICPEGHETTITWNNFQRGQGCKFCAGNIKYDYYFVKKYFEEQGCTLLSQNYENNLKSMDYICICGTKSTISFSDLKNGHRCARCKSKKLSEKAKISDNVIIEFCKNNDCQFIRSWIYSHRTRIEYICKCGETTQAFWTNFRRYPNCKKCGSKKISGSNCYMWNPDREKVSLNKRMQKRIHNILSRALLAINKKKHDYTYMMLGYSSQDLQNHIFNHPDFKFKKDSDKWHIDHIFPVKAFIDNDIFDLKIINCLDNLAPMLGRDNESKGAKYDQDEFVKWIKNQKNKNEIQILNLKFSFDEWKNTLPDFDYDIEFIDIKTTNERKDLRTKYEIIKNKGKYPLFIAPHEWNERRQQWISHIESLTGKFDRRIYARKCDVKEIDKNIAKDFCGLYHIQGRNRFSLIAWGLYYENELLGIVSLGKHNRQFDDLVLDRLCFKSNVQIIGGANKLFSKCVKWAKENNHEKIISFSNNRYSFGKIYEKLNFTLDFEFYSDYFYVDSNDFTKHYSKQSQKKKSVNCPENLTELQWSEIRGLKRIWDCGKKRWIYRI